MERSDRALAVPAVTAAPPGAFTTLSLNRPDYSSHLLTDSSHAGVEVPCCLINPFLCSAGPTALTVAALQ